ncbi:MAG: hypothetical protein EOO15_18150 [Chitinophagaceae bacterium]|nr:MAG: hypothetical protein EOO15_18150 [Chitinophagaceae bacterium]
MSRNFYIETNRTLPIYELMEARAETFAGRGVQLLVRHPVYYFYEADSFQGVELLQEPGRIAVRTFFGASGPAYSLAGWLLRQLARITGGRISNEAGEPLLMGLLDGDSARFVREDVALLRVALQSGLPLQFNSPFGPYAFDEDDLEAPLSNPDPWGALHRVLTLLKKQYAAGFAALPAG